MSDSKSENDHAKLDAAPSSAPAPKTDNPESGNGEEERKSKRANANARESKSSGVIAILSTLIAVAGFLWGVYAFKAQQNQRLAEEKVARERDFKKTFWQKQLEAYLQTTQAAATLAKFNEDVDEGIKPERTKAMVRFWQLYYGEMAVVADDKVRQKMAQFGNCLRGYELKICDQSLLKQYALELAQECRDSVGKSWDEPLGQLEKVNESGGR